MKTETDPGWEIVRRREGWGGLTKYGVLTITLSLAACSSLTSAQNNLDVARAGYDAAFLTPAKNYRQLGFCATGTAATLAKPCADRAIVTKLVAQDTTVAKAFADYQAQITSGNTIGANAAFQTLQIAISTAEATAANLGVK